MKPDKRPGVAKPSEPRGFYELAKAHVEAHGGVWFVADKGQTRQQWRAWVAYFAWLDEQTVRRGRKATTFRALEALTVPAEWPLEFDASAPPAPPAPLPEPKPQPVSAGRSRELAEMLRGVVADHQLREQRAPIWRDMGSVQAEDRLEELAAAYAHTPATLSAQMRKKYLHGASAEADPEELDV